MSFPRAFALLIPLMLAACADEASRPVAGGDPEADSALAILGRVTPALSASAFERLHDVAFTAEVRTRGAGSLDAVRRVRNERRADGSTRLRLLAGPGEAGERLEDPVSGLVPGTPPYLAPRTRDRYRVRMVHATSPSGRRLAGAEASLIDRADDEPVRMVRAWTEAATGEPYALEVVRQASSAIFDEAGRAGVRFRVAPGGLLPAAAAGRSRVDVPFGPPRIVEVDILISEDGP